MGAVWLRLRRGAPWSAIAVFTVLAATQAHAPLHLDNMDYPAAAEAAAEHGQPYFYRGEENPRHNFLYHTPLYTYTLALWFKLLGAGPAQARSLGALCALLFCWLTVRLSRRLLGPPSRAVDWALWPIFLLQAYTLQSSAILDIDTSIYGPLLLLVIACGVHLGRETPGRPEWRELLLLAVLVALSLWTKLTTVWAVLALIPVLLWPRLRWWRSIAAAAGACGIGILLFLATYYLYGRLLGCDVGYSFDFLIQSFLRNGRRPAYVDNLAMMLPFMAKWTGVLPWIAALLVFTPGFARHFRLRGGRLLQLRAIVALALIGSLYYMGQTSTFGRAPFKYTYVFWPLVLLPWALVSGGATVALLRQRWPLWTRLAARGGIVATFVGAFLLGRCVWRDGYLAAWTPAPKMLWLPAVLAVVAAMVWWFGGRAAKAAPLLWLVAVGAQVGFQLGVATFQASTDHSTSYDYGQSGMVDTIAYVRSHTVENAVISSMKDIGYQTDRRYIENYAALYGGGESAERLRRAWEDGTVALIVFTEEIGQDQVALQPTLVAWLAENARLVARFGHYRIYRPRAARDEAFVSPYP